MDEVSRRRTSRENPENKLSILSRGDEQSRSQAAAIWANDTFEVDYDHMGPTASEMKQILQCVHDQSLDDTEFSDHLNGPKSSSTLVYETAINDEEMQAHINYKESAYKALLKGLDLWSSTPRRKLDKLSDDETSLIDSADLVPTELRDAATELDISALLDPSTYWSSLQDNTEKAMTNLAWFALSEKGDLESKKTRRSSTETGLLPANSFSAVSLRRYSPEGVQRLGTLVSIRQELLDVINSIMLMRQSGLCDEEISFLRKVPQWRDGRRPPEDTHDHECLELVWIHVKDIVKLLVLLGKVLELGGGPDGAVLAAWRALSKLTQELLRVKFTLWEDEWASVPDIAGEVSALDCVSALLALVTKSHAYSHLATPGQLIYKYTENARVPLRLWLGNKQYGIQSQRLSCLDAYLRSPVWVFGLVTEPSTKSRMVLLTTATGFTKLWGPVFAIPSTVQDSEPCRQLVALSVEGGIIARSGPDEATTNAVKSWLPKTYLSRGISHTDLVHHMHFYPTGPLRRNGFRNNEDPRMWFAGEVGQELPAQLMPFSSDALLLIGFENRIPQRHFLTDPVSDDALSRNNNNSPLQGSTRRTQTNIAEEITRHYLALQQLDSPSKQQISPTARNLNPPSHVDHDTASGSAAPIPEQVERADLQNVSDRENSTNNLSQALLCRTSRILHENSDCPHTLANHQRLNALDYHVLGTSERCYLPEEFQLNFSGGQWITAGAQKTWKLRPGVTHKMRLVEVCSKLHSANHIRGILDTKVGLEFSICTGNAERISLWETLLLAYPSSADQTSLRAAYRDKDCAVFSEYIADLAFTGIDDQGRLSLFSPSSKGVPHVWEIDKSKSLNWFQMLRDTESSACFAVASPRCLEYRCSDDTVSSAENKPGQNVSNSCFGMVTKAWYKHSRAALATKINVHGHAQISFPPWPTARLSLQCGEVEIRSTPITTTKTEQSLSCHNDSPTVSSSEAANDTGKHRRPCSTSGVRANSGQAGNGQALRIPSQLAYYSSVRISARWMANRMRKTAKTISRELFYEAMAANRVLAAIVVDRPRGLRHAAYEQLTL